MEDNLKKFALFTCVLFERNFFPYAPDGSYVLEGYIGLFMNYTHYVLEIHYEIFADFPLSDVLTVGLHESRHQ